jgi:hypothetical protein
MQSSHIRSLRALAGLAKLVPLALGTVALAQPQPTQTGRVELAGLAGPTHAPFGFAQNNFAPASANTRNIKVRRDAAGNTLIGIAPKFGSQGFAGVSAWVHRKGDPTREVGLVGPMYTDSQGKTFSEPFSVDNFGNVWGTTYVLDHSDLFAESPRQHLWIFNAQTGVTRRAGPSGQLSFQQEPSVYGLSTPLGHTASGLAAGRTEVRSIRTTDVLRDVTWIEDTQTGSRVMDEGSGVGLTNTGHLIILPNTIHINQVGSFQVGPTDPVHNPVLGRPSISVLDLKDSGFSAGLAARFSQPPAPRNREATPPGLPRPQARRASSG